MTTKTLARKQQPARKRRPRTGVAAESATPTLSFHVGKAELARLESARNRDKDPVRELLLEECRTVLSSFDTKSLLALFRVMCRHSGYRGFADVVDQGPQSA